MFVNTDWRAGMQQASRTIDDKLGEPLIITPAMIRPNFSPTYDIADAIELPGVFSWRSEQPAFNHTKGSTGSGLSIQTRHPVASFSRAALPWAIRRGDRITRCCDGASFEVTTVEPDGVARITVQLVQLGTATE